MSVFSALYRLLIGPLELFFEILFSLANNVIDNPGLSIIFLSLAMNFLVLPLYRRADAMQEEERQTNDRLKHWTAHIKKTFKGDERFMIMQTYYRQNNYKPTDALKGSVSLLLEIPFFMAAYNFLSSLPLLQGASLGPITNLGQPDGLLVLGGVAINVLPILMTVINLVSSAIYTKGMSAKSKVQLYVMATLFLVLLYDSPAGLVFYWTLNNLFSLVKNIFYKLKNPRRVLCILFSLVGAAMAVGSFLGHPAIAGREQVLLVCGLLLQLPLIVFLVGSRIPHSGEEAELTKKDRSTFWACAVFMAVLTGVMIPTGVIHASPEEFINAITRTDPLLYVLNSALTAAGLFLVWFGVFYMLAGNSGKKWMGYLMCALCVASTVNFMFFGRDYGNMSPNLTFDLAPAYGQKLENLAVLAGIALVVFFIWKKKQELFRFVALTAAVAALGMSLMNLSQINGIVTDKTQQLEQSGDKLPEIPLSKDGKNVVVLMMDRAVNSYFPYLLNEKPQLKEQFAGFTYYPNTISYGGFTNFGSPALFGGYEYTPEELNKRDQELLEDKQNEALKVMPQLFSQNGFEVTVFDPPYAGYDWIPDLSIYDDVPGVHAFNSMGMFSLGENPVADAKLLDRNRLRNFFCYSLFKTAPVVLQPYFYDGGEYNNLKQTPVREDAEAEEIIPATQTLDGLHKAEGAAATFVKPYAVLTHLEEITSIREGEGNTFLMLTNDTTHEPMLLQEPEYEPANSVDNTEYDAAHTDRFVLNGEELKMETDGQVIHYQANMAAALKLGAWFDYLRAEGVYDNTRIIIVSDHGTSLDKQLDRLVADIGWDFDFMRYNPILMVKDFGSTELTTDDSFMSNADTPTLAAEGMIDSPVNPFTGKPISSAPKSEGPQKIFGSYLWYTPENNGTTFRPGPWYSVQDNIFDSDNWGYLGEK